MRSASAVRAARSGVVVALFATLTWAGMQPAVAHESREVDRFTFVVGFINEPAYSHIPNGVDLAIRETASGEPFEDLGDTLVVDVTFGDETFTSTLRPRFGEPGRYRADFVPSRPGQWTFRFHGTVDDVEVDETFVSGPDTFNDVEDIGEASFPVQDPSTGELAERLEREVARLTERLDALEVEHDEPEADHDTPEAGDETPEAGEEPAAAAQTSDGLARGLSAGALLIGVAALGTALALRRRAS